MSEFLLYLRLGVGHIADLRGYDHLLFVAALTGAYGWRQWRPLAVLVTAFTLGHSITLALATLDVVRVPSAWVEALIPATIVVTSAVAVTRGDPSSPTGLRYALAAAFGLIHGLGFSNFLRALLGGEESLLRPLLAFNVGLELGQLAIVAVVLAVGTLARRWVSQRVWGALLALGTGAPALWLLVERFGAVARN